jgi:hypothetical protein
MGQAGATLGVADGEFDDGVATVVGVESVMVPGRSVTKAW